MRVGSETCVKEPFKGLLSASTQYCVPGSQVQATPTPPCRMGRTLAPLPGQEHQAQEDLQALRDFVVHGLPTRKGRVPLGAM